jgi:hypothetical protein
MTRSRFNDPIELMTLANMREGCGSVPPSDLSEKNNEPNVIASPQTVSGTRVAL